MNWEHNLLIADVFHDEARSFEERRDLIVKRILASRFWDAEDEDLVTIVEDLGKAPDEDRFDEFWDEFYNWCDEHAVWVATV